MKKLISFFLFFFILVLASLSNLAGGRQTVLAGDCGGPIPPAPQGVWTKSGPGTGEVTIYWKGAPHANRYAVAYGTTSNTYMYGADNIGGGQARSYTVKYLTPGTKYYFRLAAAQGCASSPFSGEVMGVAMSGYKVAAPSVGAPSMAKPQAAAVGVGKQMLWAKSGPRTGEVTLYWKNNENADNYHLIYGTNTSKPQYGALNIGKLNWFTVRRLAAGTTYYFALVPVMNNMAMYTTPFVSSVAYQPVQVVETTREALIQPPQPTITVNPQNVTMEATPSSPAGQ